MSYLVPRGLREQDQYFAVIQSSVVVHSLEYFDECHSGTDPLVARELEILMTKSYSTSSLVN